MRVAALFLMACACAAQVEFKPKLAKGQSFEVFVTRVMETGQTEMPFDAPSGRVVVSVEEAGPEGFVLSWKPDVAPLDPTILGNESVAKAAADLAGLHFEPMLSTDGKLLRLRNEAAVLEQFQKFVKTMLAVNGEQFPDPEMRKKMNEMMANTLTPEMLLALSAMDLDTFFFAGGKTFDAEKTQRATVQVANPLGGKEKVGAERAWTLLPGEAGATARTVAWTQRLDPKAMRVLMKQMMPMTDLPEEALEKLPSMDVEEEGEVTVDLLTGLPISVRHKRTQKMGTQTLLQLTTSMRVVPGK